MCNAIRHLSSHCNTTSVGWSPVFQWVLHLDESVRVWIDTRFLRLRYWQENPSGRVAAPIFLHCSNWRTLMKSNLGVSAQFWKVNYQVQKRKKKNRSTIIWLRSHDPILPMSLFSGFLREPLFNMRRGHSTLKLKSGYGDPVKTFCTNQHHDVRYLSLHREAPSSFARVWRSASSGRISSWAQPWWPYGR